MADPRMMVFEQQYLVHSLLQLQPKAIIIDIDITMIKIAQLIIAYDIECLSATTILQPAVATQHYCCTPIAVIGRNNYVANMIGCSIMCISKSLHFLDMSSMVVNHIRSIVRMDDYGTIINPQ